MKKEELIKKIEHSLFESEPKKDIHHPFHNYTPDDMVEIMDLFQDNNQDKSFEIENISAYLCINNIINFEIIERQTTGDIWFEIQIFRPIGEPLMKTPSHLSPRLEMRRLITWGEIDLRNIDSIDDYIKKLAETQIGINKFRFYNGFRFKNKT